MNDSAAILPSSSGRAVTPRREILTVEGLRTYFYTDEGVVKAVDGASLSVRQGEIMAVVGESGSGKSVTALSIMGLVDPPGRILAGTISVKGLTDNLLQLPEREMRLLRGTSIAMVFQNPLTSLDPMYRVGHQLVETVRMHARVSFEMAKKRGVDTLREVGIFDADEVFDSYPHQLGAGLRQRVAIAVALVTEPDVLIADEPTTNLDALEQAHVLMLLEEIKERLGTAILLITHDFGIVATFADRVTVMYAGKVAESGPREAIISRPRHPYTEALIGSVPMIGEKRDRLHQIQGHVPNLARLPGGCSFAPRCPLVESTCHELDPELTDVAPDHRVRCLVRGRQ